MPFHPLQPLDFEVTYLCLTVGLLAASRLLVTPTVNGKDHQLDVSFSLCLVAATLLFLVFRAPAVFPERRSECLLHVAGRIRRRDKDPLIVP